MGWQAIKASSSRISRKDKGSVILEDLEEEQAQVEHKGLMIFWKVSKTSLEVDLVDSIRVKRREEEEISQLS